jgi:hypothetical protein
MKRWRTKTSQSYTRISEGATVWGLIVSAVHGQHGVTLRNILLAFLSLRGVDGPPITGFLHRVAIKKPFKAYWSRDARTGLISNNRTLCPHCMCFVFITINSDLCPIKHRLIGFCNRDESVYNAVRTGSLDEAVCPSYLNVSSPLCTDMSHLRRTRTGVSAVNTNFSRCLVKDRVGGSGVIVPRICELRRRWLWLVSCTY